MFILFACFACPARWIIIQLNLAGPLMHVGGSIALEVRHVFGITRLNFLVLGRWLTVLTQVKRQTESRLREHFAEPLRAQAQAIKDEDNDDARELERRIPQPL